MKSAGWVASSGLGWSATRSSLFVLLSCVASLTQVQGSHSGSSCDKTPDTITNAPKTPGDNGFKIYVTGSPSGYTPGKAYTVNIEGQRYQYGSQKFLGFMLVAEPEGYHSGGIVDVGRFELTGDAMTTYSRKCQNAVTHTNIVPKTEVSVRWKAPSTPSGCVMFKAMVIERQNVWYTDDGQLQLELCPDIAGAVEEVQHEVLDECLACGEAKYEVVFEGRWSRHTHPKNYPRNEWLTHFSDLIGASHSPHLKVWEVGGYASEGLKQVALYGITRGLEGELKKHSRHIRTIIKARGLWHPRVTGKTYAVFRVDKKHHLMTLVSMLGPSPDWLLGVSSLELCQKNGSWIREKVVDLYPYDAGVDGGISYEDNDSPLPESQKIRRITSSWPDDPRSPFYDRSGTPMKPLATLTVRRQKEYEKSDCNKNNNVGGGMNFSGLRPKGKGNKGKGKNKNRPGASWQGLNLASAGGMDGNRIDIDGPAGSLDEMPDEQGHFVETPENSGDALKPECATTQWSSYSQCSATCGDGLRRRSRMYRNPLKAQRTGCNRQLEETEMCRGVYPDCNSLGQPVYAPFEQNPPADRSNSYDYDPESDGEDNGLDPDCERRCAPSAWSNWSPCSVTCGTGGVKTRTRRCYYPRGIKVCKEVVKEEMGCDGPVPFCPSEESADHMSRPECEVTPWSDWSPCGVSCGKGVSVRTRMYLDEQLGTRSCDVQLLESAECNGTSTQCHFTQQTALDGVPNRRHNSSYLPAGTVAEAHLRRGSDNSSSPTRFYYCELAKRAQNIHEILQYQHWCSLARSYRSVDPVLTRATGAHVTQLKSATSGAAAARVIRRRKDKMGRRKDSNKRMRQQKRQEGSRIRRSVAENEDELVGLKAAEICTLPEVKGPCRGSYTRWFYDPATKTCREFNYGGCKGNGNNFETYNECTKKCQMTLAGAGDYNAIQSQTQPTNSFSSKKRMLMQQAMMNEKHAMLQKQNRLKGAASGGNSAYGTYDHEDQYSNHTEPDLSWMNANDQESGQGNYMTGYKTQGYQKPGDESDVRNLYKLLAEKSYKQGGGHLYKSSLLGQGQVPTVNPTLMSGGDDRGEGNFEYFKADKEEEVAEDQIQPGDCVMSPWSKWSPCSTTCGRGMRERKRYLIVYPLASGKPCPAVSETEQCEMPLCHSGGGQNQENQQPGLSTKPQEPQQTYRKSNEVAASNNNQQQREQPAGSSTNEDQDEGCIVGAWNTWSSCDATCGEGHRQRWRIVAATQPGLNCGHSVEHRRCTRLPPCPKLSDLPEVQRYNVP